jgi:tight adherence protein C
MFPLLSALSIVAAVLCGAMALRPRTRGLASSRVAELKRGNSASTENADLGSPVIGTREGRWDGEVRRWMPTSLLAGIERRLIAAGRPAGLAEFTLVALMLGSALAALPLSLAVAYDANPGAALVFALLGAAAGGFLLPGMWLRRRVKDRRNEVWRSLPDAADLLTTCVEAGLDINASFARVALELAGPLQEEVQTMLREVSLGRRRRDAIEDIGRRTGVEDLTGMLQAIVQAEESGTSLAGVLRAQSRHIRNSRRLFAEERARVIPAKMTFPIIFLILPTLFILVLGPLGIEVWEQFHS